MKKKGQITIFIIVGLIILIVLSLFLYVKNYQIVDKFSSEEDLPIDTNHLKYYLESCLKKLTSNALEDNLQQGGYYYVSGYYTQYSIYKIPYFFDQSILEVPTINYVENELNQHISDNFFKCIDKLDQLKINYTIQSDPTINTKIYPEKLNVKLNLKVIFTEDNILRELNNFEIELPVRLMDILNLRDQIITEQTKFPNEIRTSKLVNLATENNFELKLVNFNNTVIYLIKTRENNRNNRNNINNQNGENDVEEIIGYNFAINYDWS